MSSSSTFNTAQEEELLTSYFAAHARLQSVGCETMLDSVSVLYSVLLETETEDLVVQAVNNRSWVTVAENIWKLPQPQKILGASNVVCTGGWILKHYGRHEEAVWCFDLAAYIRNVAEMMSEEEATRAEKREYRKRRYAESIESDDMETNDGLEEDW